MSQSRLAARPHRLAFAIAALLPFGPVLAQDAAPPATTPQASTLDAVQVTAQRKVENIQDVPVSISSVSGEKLDVLGSGGNDVRFLSARVPSLNIESSYGRAFPRFYIRGLGNTDFDLNASQPVSLIYDEVVQESPLLKGFPVFDLERIEVLRGPQGTLFGRNTPAGVVKFESAKPTRELDGYAQLSYGTDDMYNFEGAIGGPLSERWSARVSALYQRKEDWVTNTYEPGPDRGAEGYDETAARVQFLYEGDAFEALFNLHKRHLNGTARLFRANIIQKGTNNFVPGFDKDKVSTDGVNFSELDTWGGSARLRWDLGDYNLYSITGYETAESLNRGDIDGGYGAVFLPVSGPGVIPFASESADGLPDHKQITQEFRIESDYQGAFNWQAGLFFYKEDITIDSFNYDSLSNGNPQAGHAIQTQKNDAWAVFASGEYQATDKLKLRGGVRYTQDEKDFSASVLEGAPFGAPVGGPYTVNTDKDNVSWDLSAVYAANDDINLFARVATGFRAPSVQGRLLFANAAAPNGGVSTADSETVISYEAGVKADLWDKRARLGFTVFRYDVEDQQIIAVGGGANIATLLNADKTRGQGFELDLEAYVIDNLLVTLGSSYNDTEIKDADLGVAPCGGGCTVTDPIVDGFARINGNSLPQAPEWVHNLTARYSIPMGEGNELYFYTDWAYRSEVNFFLYESVEFTGKSSLEGGLRIGYGWNYGDYEVALFGRNITDQTRIVGGIDFNNLTGFINEPRSVGAEFTMKF
ncbi:TonB-dependent receptor [Pseudoxanthomonas indica]|uniref:Iron complex outermembrane recepter protein n=1 Tax=Pseudoxanthomonas indica TaxID=428993 RepID=A0A1T5KN28_9GAMM|nr:TonB-dependent receptor [Pseudoxanthomonas indica]GGD50411.1 TonB-dependent receptor [Pseudoxanthomonas indica]SKC65182.1 iron complex outermembrane recepter protein [Pseudoxanthomonas indica]